MRKFLRVVRRWNRPCKRRYGVLRYPFGDEQSITPEVLAMPQRAGFDMAFVNFGGGLGVDLPAYALPRIHVTAEMSLPEFEAHISGFYARLQRRAGRTPQTVESMRAA